MTNREEQIELIEKLLISAKRENENVRKVAQKKAKLLMDKLGITLDDVLNEGTHQKELLPENTVIYNLKLVKAISKELKTNTRTITKYQLEKLNKLNAKNLDIKSISGLEYAVNLKQLDLSGNLIDDIKAVSKLKKLKKLNLSNNFIIDVQPLSELSFLEHLDLSNNDISDVFPIATNRNMKKLSLCNMGFKNLLFITAFPILEYLDIRGCQKIMDWSCLVNRSIRVMKLPKYMRKIKSIKTEEAPKHAPKKIKPLTGIIMFIVTLIGMILFGFLFIQTNNIILLLITIFFAFIVFSCKI